MSSQRESTEDSESQAEILAELTELVVIMQSEAEDLLALADLVEEYVEEVDLSEQVAGIEDWADDQDLDLGYGSASSSPVKENMRDRKHTREDSAVSLASTDAGDLMLSEDVYREMPILRSHTPDRREVKEVTIRGEGVVLKPVAMEKKEDIPVVKAPVPKRLLSKKSFSAFRDSGISMFSSSTKSGSVKSKKSVKSSRGWDARVGL